MNSKVMPLSIAFPKGRLFDRSRELFAAKGISIDFDERKLVARDEEGSIESFLVKNSDLPTYVKHGIAGIGVCGGDVLYESGTRFVNLGTLPFGSTRMCLAAKRGFSGSADRVMKVATKFTRFAKDYFHGRGIPIRIIKLNGSVELAPILGLAPYIVDLVETGTTLEANDLEVLEELETIRVHLIANPAYYKLNYERVNALADLVVKEEK
jgi:ATP phosphoribosyltransferase